MSNAIIFPLKDPQKWTAASGPASFPAVPVQIKVESKTKDGLFNTDVSSITRFRTFLTLEEENYMVRKGSAFL